VALADQTGGGSWYNGDDAVVLRRGSAVVDVIGQVGTDPGAEWGSGATSTADNTLRRKPPIVAGDTDGGDAFDPAVQWDGFAVDTFDGLGAHQVTPPADQTPEVTDTQPMDGATGVSDNQPLTVTFSEEVDSAPGAFTLSCGGDDVVVTVTGGPTRFTIDPESVLPLAAECVLTVHADHVTDRDGAPQAMAADHRTDFRVWEVNPCTLPFTPAYAIQGSGPAPAVTGPGTTTQGVVVGDYEGGTSPDLRGFYLQDLEGDADDATSDAVFVFNGSADEVAIGDVVRVTGTAGDFQDQTQVAATEPGVVTCGSTATVEPAEVRLPFAGEADRERFEGMLVTLPQTLAVTEHFQLGRFGQVLMSARGRLAQPTNVVPPGRPANRLQAANDLNKVLLDDASQRQNPDPILFAREGAPLSASNTLRGGDTAGGTVGVMTYTWGGNAASPNAFRVRPIAAMGGQVRFEAANERPAAPDEVGGDLQVASFNVLNYFNTFGDNCRPVGPDNDTACRGADNAVEFERQADKVVAAITGLDADVVGVIEIENDGYGPGSALQDLVDRLDAEAGAGTYAFIDADAGTGQVDALGLDAIKVGLLYKPDAALPVGRTAALNTESFVNGGRGTEPRNRPALAQTFQDDDGGRVTVAVNHLKSKGSDCNSSGDPDTGDGQGNCNLTRLSAARELAEWLAGDPTAVDDADVLVMGDLNSYAREDPVTALRRRGYDNLVRRFEGRDAYSYVFDGQWGYLDHALASRTMRNQVTGTTTWHINADEPPVLDYNTDFKSPGQVVGLYAPDPYRSSDHDPVLVGLDPRVGKRVTDRWVTGHGSYDVDGRRATFALDVRYPPRRAEPTGRVALTVPGVGTVTTASFGWLATDAEHDLAYFTGAAQLNGQGGYTLTAFLTDRRRHDTVHFVLTDAAGAVVHDTGVACVRSGNVTLHRRGH
jgi:predicted extracellular nuclease